MRLSRFWREHLMPAEPFEQRVGRQLKRHVSPRPSRLHVAEDRLGELLEPEVEGEAEFVGGELAHGRSIA